jgi:hypothetical protein
VRLDQGIEQARGGGERLEAFAVGDRLDADIEIRQPAAQGVEVQSCDGRIGHHQQSSGGDVARHQLALREQSFTDQDRVTARTQVDRELLHETAWYQVCTVWLIGGFASTIAMIARRVAA